MDDLAAWLTQIYDAIEQAAEACAEVYPSPWDVIDRGHTASVRADEPHFRYIAELEQNPAVDGWLGDRLQHIARHDPASVLARIAADRQILALHGMTRIGWNKGWVDPTMHQREYCAICDHGRDDDSAYPSQSSYPCQTVRLLALPYADRPGYQEAWKPEA